MKPRVVYANNIPSPYFVRRMNYIADRSTIEVEAWFCTPRFADRSWDVDETGWLFPYAYIGTSHRARISHTLRRLRAHRPDAFVSLYEDAAFATGIAAARMLNIPTIVHAMRTFESWRPRGAMREALKHVLFRFADGVNVCGPDSAEYVKAYGAPVDKVFAIREEIDTDYWFGATRRLAGERAEFRAAVGLTGCAFLYVGRLVPEKGVGDLLRAFSSLRSQGVDVSLALVGDGTHAALYRAAAENIPGVVFGEFCEGDELARWFTAADVFVFPTLGDPYGHVTQEAMACGLPVLASTSAGDITDRVIQGVTGGLFPARDPLALRDAMASLAGDPRRRRAFGKAGRERVQAWSTQQWAEGFEAMIHATIAQARR